jgi:hypothetical protein
MQLGPDHPTLRAMHQQLQEIERQIQQLKEGERPMPDAVRPPAAEEPNNPQPLTQYRGQVGQRLSFVVVGSADGQTIWGDNPYTDDSPLDVAAIHAGILKPGQRGTVIVVIEPGQGAYTGSTRNGVTSQPFAAWGGSYRIVTDANDNAQ